MRNWLFILAFLASSVPAFAAEVAADAPPAQEPHHTAAKLTSVWSGVGTSATVPVTLGLRLEPGWKTYWRTPGESGLAPAFDWTGSTNFKAAAVRWPAPHRYVAEDLDNFVYQDGVVFPFDVTLAEPGKPVALKLKVDLLVCKEICLPEKWELALDIPAGAGTAVSDAVQASYDDALRKIPRRDDAGFTAAYLNFDTSNNAYLVVEAKPSSVPMLGADLFVEHGAGITFGKPEVVFSGKAGAAKFTAPVHSADPFEKISGQLSGSPLTLTVASSSDSVEGTLSLSPKPEGVPPVKQQLRAKAAVVKTLSGLQVALFAFLGGLILNLMPCVLPVLSLKILSVLSHGGKESRRKIFGNFAASALGIMFSFWVMAAVLAALKSGGQMIGWGIQFQSPAFLVFLIVTVLAFAASMWGFFDIPLPRFIAKNIPAKHEHEPTLLGHFLTGAFATLLATPCTAPFLGTAVGFGLSGNTAEIFAVFTMIGLGLASPYFLLALSPRLFKYLPKPGKWMIVLKRILSLALVLTAAWLISVLLTITSTPALDAGWEKFDEALIAPAVDSGKIVVVDVTADWCLTCKANKRLVIDQDEIVEALSGPEILRLQADWTQRDEVIGAYLQKHGRYGIPFNMIYGPGAPDGVALPELLTKKAVLDGLAEAAGE